MTQPTNAEIEGLLQACRAPFEDPSRRAAVTWKNRVFALKEAFDMRTHWRGNYEVLLREAVVRYLRGAGLKI